jgi:hypothetical protein
MMKRWMLFAGQDHYPAGGMEDFQGDYDTLVECIEEYYSGSCDWWNVVDTVNRTVICSYMSLERSKAALLERAQKIDNGENV